MGNLNIWFNFLFFNQKQSDRSMYEKDRKIVNYFFIVTFLMPIASYADGRVRFNYRVAGSTSVILSWGQKMLRLTLRQMDQLLRAKTSLIQAPSALSRFTMLVTMD